MSRLIEQQGSFRIPTADESNAMQPKADKGVPPKLWKMLRYRLDDAAAAKWVDLPFEQLNGRTARQIFNTPGSPTIRDISYLVKDIHNHYIGVTTDQLFSADEILAEWLKRNKQDLDAHQHHLHHE